MSHIPDPHADANILDMIAADGDRGFGEGLKPAAVPALKIADFSNCDPAYEWFVEGAEEGDLILGKQSLVLASKVRCFSTACCGTRKNAFPANPTSVSRRGGKSRETRTIRKAWGIRAKAMGTS